MDIYLLKPTFIRVDGRGAFVEAINGPVWENIIFGKMNQEAIMGNHYHKKTQVFFYIMEGSAQVDMIDVRKKEMVSVMLGKNQGILLLPYHSHAIRFQQDSTFVMGKSKKFDERNPDTFEYIVPQDGINYRISTYGTS